jgi:four helix bundle protein
MSGMGDFKKLKVWRKAHGLTLNVDRAALRIRKRASLRSQMTRAAQSIGSIIVEGRGHESDREFARCLRMSVDSAYELEYHLITARDLKAITQRDFLALLSETIEVRKMLYGLIDRIKQDGSKKDRPEDESSS